MTPSPVLELASIATRHPPYGESLLGVFGAFALDRLRGGRARTEPDVTSRAIVVDFRCQPGDSPPVTVMRVVDWSVIPKEVERNSLELPHLFHARHVTEFAAVGIMALMVSDLENVRLSNVVQIGAGADYEGYYHEQGDFAVEVSGVHVPRAHSDCTQRFREKDGELLKKREAGHVSVTTFCCPPSHSAHTTLHFVKRPQANVEPPSESAKANKGSVMTPTVEIPDAAQSAIAEAMREFAKGDTLSASEAYRRAGRLLVDQAASQDTNARSWTLFLAASQYYHGGAYSEAYELSRQISPDTLPVRHRPLLEELGTLAHARASPAYLPKMRGELRGRFVNSDYARMLDILKHHPYLLDRTGMAFVRAVCCHHRGEYQAAAAFFSTAFEFTPELFIVCSSVYYMYSTNLKNKLADTREYYKSLHKFLPHPLTAAGAAVAEFLVARIAPPPGDFTRQLALFDVARQGVLKDPALAAHEDAGPLLLMAYETAMMAYNRRNEAQRIEELAEEAIAFWPTASGPHVMRGLARRSGEEARQAFTRAAELGAHSYIPYYHLSQIAFNRADHEKARDWGLEALKRVRPGEQGRGRLHLWVAACLGRTGASREKVLAMATEAKKISPHDPAITKFVDFLKAHPETKQSPPDPEWQEPGEMEWEQELNSGLERTRKRAEAVLSNR